MGGLGGVWWIAISRTMPSLPDCSPPDCLPSDGPSGAWRGVHFSLDGEDEARALVGAMKDLQGIGVNVIIAEVDYRFAFAAPYADYAYRQASKAVVSLATARDLAHAARDHGIRLIPEFDCLGHQGINEHIYPLLALHPEFNQSHLDPLYPRISVHAWCPREKRVMPIVRDLIDQIATVFEADAFHVGMDEVMHIGTQFCHQDCATHAPAALFAAAVQALHDHVVTQNGHTMLMWGDRLVAQSRIPGATDGEASANHTEDAVSLIPKDIIICDWRFQSAQQYQGVYPSLEHFLSHGFRVWPAGYAIYANARSLSQRALALRPTHPNLIGYLCTTWNLIDPPAAATSPSIRDVLRDW